MDTPLRRISRLACLGIALLLPPTSVARAQTVTAAALPPGPGAALAADSTSIPPRAAPHRIRLWEGALAVGGVALSSILDQRLRNSLQSNRTGGKDDAAAVFRRMGQPEVYATIGLGTTAVGLIAGRPAVTRAGARITSSLLLAGIITGGGKLAVGRARPFESPADAFRLKPFSGNDAFPSGHATLAFALAGSVANEVHRPLVTVLLYTAAAGTAWSRLNDDKHWLSDVLAGALVGTSSAQFIGGKWTVFGLQPPHALMTPRGAGLGWSGAF